MYCSSSAVPSVATQRACVSPRVNSAEPCVRGRTPTCEVMARIWSVLRPSMRVPVRMMSPRTTLASASLNCFLEHQRISARRVGFGLHEHGLGLLARSAHGGVAFALVLDLVGGGEIRAGNVLDRLQQRGVIRAFERERVLGGFLGELDDRLDDGLEALVAGFHGAEHDVFRKLLGFGFNHHHAFGGAGDDEVELEAFHLLGRRVDDVLRRPCSRRGQRRSGQRTARRR